MRFSMLRQIVLTVVVGTATAVFLAGCGGGDDSSTDSADGQAALQGTGGATGEHRDHDHAGHDHAGHDHGDHGDGDAHDEEAEAIAKNLAKLSDEDRALAAAQKLCPIGKGPLGASSMGVPYKLELNGKAVFLCCSGCKDKAEGDAEATLATVAALVAENSDESVQ